MAESNHITPAVALPDSDRDPSSPESRRKRRPSLREETDNKRRRVSAEIKQHLASSPPRRRSTLQSTASVTATAPATETKDAKAPTGAKRTGRKSGVEEERKRGQRLFGGLLGTLSQSSTTTAQRRRADIEKKQQAKLKDQDAEYDGNKKRGYEDLMAARRKEQKIYDRHAMGLRHSNMLAMAHSLKTDTEPVLYYKPWELRSEDEERISNQIQETKATIAWEVTEFERLHPPTPPEPEIQAAAPTNEEAPADETNEDDPKKVENSEPVGDDTNKEQQESEQEQLSHAHPHLTDVGTNDIPTAPPDHESESKRHQDEAGEVVLEDNEDTVIY